MQREGKMEMESEGEGSSVHQTETLAHKFKEYLMDFDTRYAL